MNEEEKMLSGELYNSSDKQKVKQYEYKESR